jgi:hypothetical protein
MNSVWVAALMPAERSGYKSKIRITVSATEEMAYWDLAAWLEDAEVQAQVASGDFESEFEVTQSLSDQNRKKIIQALNSSPLIVSWVVEEHEIEDEPR